MHIRIGDKADAAQQLFDLASLHFELMRVIDVLVTAPAAASKIPAGRDGAFVRRFENVNQLAFSKLLFLADDSRRDALTLNCERNENGLAAGAPNACSPERYVVDRYFYCAHR